MHRGLAGTPQSMSSLARRAARMLAGLAGLAVVAAVAIGVALLVTPMQNVTVAGQVISVGTATPALNLTGPGEVDLFGQALPTALQFTGPVRPRLALTRITIDSELANFVQGASTGRATQRLGSALTSGWLQYFGWEAAIAAVTALAMAGALAGWRRLPAGPTARLLAAALVGTELLNAGAIALAAHDTQHALRHVRSLSQLAGSDPARQVTRKARPVVTGVHAIVIGDSTAAGAGLAPIADPSRVDQACGRSSDSYAEDLASANGWKVMNLACDSATIASGLLSGQARSGMTIPPQVSSARQVAGASAVIVSVGADDLQWSALLAYCATAAHCDDNATAAYFQQKLAKFSTEYLDLLAQLAALPGHPQVIINRYYSPFGKDVSCLTRRGLPAANVPTLISRLATLNSVLAKGAAEFGDASPRPDFTGHQLCSSQPYVQGPSDPAPLHPTALGQLAIAIADEAALAAHPAASPSASPSASASASPSASSPVSPGPAPSGR